MAGWLKLGIKPKSAGVLGRTGLDQTKFRSDGTKRSDRVISTTGTGRLESPSESQIKPFEIILLQFNIPQKNYPIPVFSCFCCPNTENYTFFTVESYHYHYHMTLIKIPNIKCVRLLNIFGFFIEINRNKNYHIIFVQPGISNIY